MNIYSRLEAGMTEAAPEKATSRIGKHLEAT